MNGFLLIDKPVDISSFAAVYMVRKRLSIKKVGHAGTLDPFATGLLLIALGAYTRLITHCDAMPKEYTATGMFGETRDTDDATGAVTETFPEKAIPREEIEALLRERFTGAIRQTPPRYSALKVNGQRAYEKARDGDEFTLAERDATVHSIELLDYAPPAFTVRMSVSRGTYVRSIVRDIGTALGSGAYTSILRRSRIGVLDVTKAIAPAQATAAAVLSYADLFPAVSTEVVSDAWLIEKLGNGNRHLPEITDGRHSYVNTDGILLAIADVAAGIARYEFVNTDLKRKAAVP